MRLRGAISDTGPVVGLHLDPNVPYVTRHIPAARRVGGCAVFWVCLLAISGSLVARPAAFADDTSELAGDARSRPRAEAPGALQPAGTLPEDLGRWEPWQHWGLDSEGYPPDRRLLAKTDASSSHMSIAALLALAKRETGVDLSAWEPRLRAQQVTVFAPQLPLNALMVQLAELLGIYWYQTKGAEGPSYVVSYGSGPPSARVASERLTQDAQLRSLRASRIAEYVNALALSDGQLRDLVKTDPMLAGSMLHWPATRYGARLLAGLRPYALRRFIDDGLVTVGAEELPAWVTDGLREDFRAEDWENLDITSADMLVSNFRVIFLSDGLPEDEMQRELTGGAWSGMSYLVAVRPGPKGTSQIMKWGPSESPGLPKDVALPEFLPFVEHSTTGSTGGGGLPGKMGRCPVAELAFPDLFDIGGKGSFSERAGPMWDRIQERAQDRLTESPWKEDVKLSQPLRAPLSVEATMAEVLSAVADQTGYSVVGTYFEQRDLPVGIEVSDQEPIYLLMNRMAKTARCSWELAGSVILWRHDDWYVLEANQLPDDAFEDR
jgi:hypothetical protein